VDEDYVIMGKVINPNVNLGKYQWEWITFIIMGKR
jgi:hypothetical protein